MSESQAVRELRSLIEVLKEVRAAIDGVPVWKEVERYSEAVIAELEAAKRNRDEAIHQRDQSIKEANRRDQKWMDGINECLGRKLDYGNPTSPDAASTALASLVKQLATVTNELEAANKFMTQLVDERDEAEGAIDQAYEIVTGKTPEWSNNFGFRDACHGIEAQLATMTQERDRLQRDSEDLDATQKHVETLLAELEAVTKERDNLKEDVKVSELGPTKDLLGQIGELAPDMLDCPPVPWSKMIADELARLEKLTG